MRPVIVKVRYRHVRMGNRVSSEEYMSSIEATPSPGQTTRFMCSTERVWSASTILYSYSSLQRKVQVQEQ